jgi:hypothetical protein
LLLLLSPQRLRGAAKVGLFVPAGLDFLPFRGVPIRRMGLRPVDARVDV